MELLHQTLRLQFLSNPVNKSGTSLMLRKNYSRSSMVFSSSLGHLGFPRQNAIKPPLPVFGRRSSLVKNSKIDELLRRGGRGDDDDDDDDDDDEEEEGSSRNKRDYVNEDPFMMNPDERMEWRQKIREVIGKVPDVEEEADLVEKRKKMKKLLAEYPLVVEEEDPDWPENDEGWGFSLGQFFNKVSVKNVKKDDDDEDDDEDSENEIVWQDDDYIRPIKNITTGEWEEAVFKDISPLVVLVHNRYKRPKENERIQKELERAVNIIWNCSLPSPRCVAIDANTELDLVSALQVSAFPELIFTKAGKILYREKEIRTADQLSKIMAFFYFGAAKPPCLDGIESADEAIPTV